MKKNNKKLKELKNKLHETKKIDNLSSISSIHKNEIKTIFKANKSPKGERNIQNKPQEIIELRNVNKTYLSHKNKYQALKNVSLSIKKGEFVIILGTSGSGKTSLLNIMSGLDRSTSGDIIIDNLNISSFSNRELTTFRRNKIGFIFQTYNLLLELNARDNAEMGRQLQIDNTKRISVDKLFDQVGLSDNKKASITNLSGGQLQRVSIVRALAKNPEIICADEPTGALDSKTSKKIIDLFIEINKTYKTTIIFVTHNEQYSQYADKIIRVNDGLVDVQVK